MASKVVLITGANTGIGYQVVRALCSASQAYTVFVSGRSLEKVNDAINSANKEFPSTKSELLPVQIDLESDDSIKSAFEHVKSKTGKLDALVNNAGKPNASAWKNKELGSDAVPRRTV
jgi:NAD(P)-dependent dehydrogenase (short-subunit alcohol dehydrogenase family)